MALACGGTSNSQGFGNVGDGGSSGSGGSGSSGSGSGGSGSSSGIIGGSGSGGSGSSSGGNGCSGAAANYVYVLSVQNDLYSFAPNLKQFTKIGPLQCQTGGMTPNSMAVDRNADAYVNYMDPTGAAGAIYKVSTQNASCSAQPVMTLPTGWTQVGMGYSTIGVGSTSEALYVDGIGMGTGMGSGLGLVDFGKLTVGPIGQFTGVLAGQSGELTGTGDGRLFGFFTSTPVYVAQIDKSSGATANPVPMTGLQVPTDWAFSFWGGHFYLYTSQGAGTTVTDYDPVSGAINLNFMPNIGFDIVGAGVSTCAPTIPPQ